MMVWTFPAIIFSPGYGAAQATMMPASPIKHERPPIHRLLRGAAGRTLTVDVYLILIF
jgi:hypothetical protein